MGFDIESVRESSRNNEDELITKELLLSYEEYKKIKDSGVKVIISPKGNLVVRRGNSYQLAYCYRNSVPCCDLCALFKEPVEAEDGFMFFEICTSNWSTSTDNFIDLRLKV